MLKSAMDCFSTSESGNLAEISEVQAGKRAVGSAPVRAGAVLRRRRGRPEMDCAAPALRESLLCKGSQLPSTTPQVSLLKTGLSSAQLLQRTAPGFHAARKARYSYISTTSSSSKEGTLPYGISLLTISLRSLYLNVFANLLVFTMMQ